MTLLWIFVGVSLLVAIAAWSQARKNAKRLAQLSEMYWELKYQNGELRVRLQQVAGDAPPPPPQSPGPPDRPREGFVPLASLKR